VKSMSFPWPNADEREVHKFWEEFLQQLESAQGLAPTWASPTSWLEVWRRKKPRSWLALFKLRNEVLSKIEREMDFAELQPTAEPRGVLLDDLQKFLWPSDFMRETDCPRCLARLSEASQLVSHLKSCRG
jgi:hypothetical protein